MAKEISAGKVALSTTISLTAYNRLAQKRAETGTPIGDYIDHLILDDSDVYSDYLDVIIKNLAFIETNLKRKKQQAKKLYRKIANLPKNHDDYATMDKDYKTLWSAADEAMLEAILTAKENLKLSFQRINQLEKELEEEFETLVEPPIRYKY